MNYQQLLALFKETHHELHQRADWSVATSLVIRNWRCENPEQEGMNDVR